MKFKIKGSILFLIIQLIYFVHGRTVNKFFIEQDNLQPINLKQNDQIDKNDILKRIEESNKYHRNINELEFDYFNMLTNRKKKSQTVKDNEFNFLKNQLIKPPYMYTNYNHQSNLEDQSNDQLKADKDQFINNQLEVNDKLITMDKLDNEQSINKTVTTTNQTITEQKKNWFVRVINKLKLGWRLKSSSNLNPTNSTATKEKLKYYEDYDVMMGVRIAYTLFSLFTIFTLFVTYKSYRNYRKQSRHRRESEKKRKAEDNEQTTGSRRAHVHVPPKLNKFNSIRGSSGRMSSKTFVKLKTNKEEDFN